MRNLGNYRFFYDPLAAIKRFRYMTDVVAPPAEPEEDLLTDQQIISMLCFRFRFKPRHNACVDWQKRFHRPATTLL